MADARIPRTSGANLAANVREWADALEHYTPFRDALAECHELLRPFAAQEGAVTDVARAMAGWCHRRFPSIWSKAGGPTFAEMSLAVEMAIRAGTWEAFVNLLGNLSAFKKARPVVVLSVSGSGAPPQATVETRVAITLQALPWATKEDLLRAIEADFAALVQPALYAASPSRGRGGRAELRRQVDLYILWLEFCRREGTAPDTADRDRCKRFFGAIARKHDRIDTGHIWPHPPKGHPDRTTVEDMFANACAWLQADPSVPPIQNLVDGFIAAYWG